MRPRNLMACAVLALLAFAAGVGALMVDTSKDSSDHGKCLVWHSQHKSAGGTFEERIHRAPLATSGLTVAQWKACTECTFVCDAGTWSCAKQTCEAPATFNPNKGQRVAVRGYVQALAGSPTWGRAGDGRCVWATMSRDPTARLVSAYLYCKYRMKSDPLCGTVRLNAQHATLGQFADHWGNYLLRELLYFPQLRALAESRPDFNTTLHCQNVDGKSKPAPGFQAYRDPWVQFKDQLNGGDDVDTESGRLNFEAVRDHLFGQNGAQPLYDVVGVVEEMEDSLRLFQHFMPLAESPEWIEMLENARVETHGSEDWADEKEQLLAQAQRDPAIQRAIKGDVMLYQDVIVPLFHAEVDKYLK